LIAPDARKPLKKIVHIRSRLEILEESAYRNTSVSKDPRAANPFRIAFHDRAILPIEHVKKIR